METRQGTFNEKHVSKAMCLLPAVYVSSKISTRGRARGRGRQREIEGEREASYIVVVVVVVVVFTL